MTRGRKPTGKWMNNEHSCMNCSHIILHNCRIQHSTKQFRKSSLLTFRQLPRLILLETGKAIISYDNSNNACHQYKFTVHRTVNCTKATKWRKQHTLVLLRSAFNSAISSSFSCKCSRTCVNSFVSVVKSYEQHTAIALQQQAGM